MASQESSNELQYLRAVEHVIEEESLQARPNMGRVRRMMWCMDGTHGIVWKAIGCTGSREHDPLASDIVDRALEMERRHALGDVSTSDFESFQDFHCEPCGWSYRVLYLQWKGLRSPADLLRPAKLLSVHKGWHTRQNGPSRPIDAAERCRRERERYEASAHVLIDECVSNL